MRPMRLVQLIAVALISLIILNVLPFPDHNTAGDLAYIVKSIIDLWKGS